MQVAIKAIQEKKPKRIVVAVPVAPPDTCRQVAQLVDEIICLRKPTPFHAVGLWYSDFDQTTDEEVQDLLQKAQPFRKKKISESSSDAVL
jgi:putative phosphoribosyl transferase